MIRCRRLASSVTILLLAVSCTSQHAGMETGDDNAVVDAVFASSDVPGSPGCALAVAQDGALAYSRRQPMTCSNSASTLRDGRDQSR